MSSLLHIWFLPHFYCAITRYCCGASLTCIVLNLHILFSIVLGPYMCTLSCIAVTVSYLKWTVSKGKITYHCTHPLTHNAHMVHILSRPKGQWGAFKSIFQHTLLCYPPLYLISVSQNLMITGHSLFPVSVFIPQLITAAHRFRHQKDFHTHICICMHTDIQYNANIRGEMANLFVSFD